jgi:hypothetical protein
MLSSMNSLYFILGMMLFFSVFLTIIFRLEKKMIWPYGELGAVPPFGDATGYGQTWVTSAMDHRFKFLGWAPDVKGPTYQVSYAMLVSPERDTFAIVGVGTVMKIPLHGTWLHTPAVDGRSYFSTDNPAGLQLDMSGDWRCQFAPCESFGNLLKKHREWLSLLNVTPRSFSDGNEMAEFRALREQHFRSMERAGLISFTDGAATHFHFTMMGAARTAIWSYFSGMMRRVTMGRFPRTT